MKVEKLANSIRKIHLFLYGSAYCLLMQFGVRIHLFLLANYSTYCLHFIKLANLIRKSPFLARKQVFLPINYCSTYPLSMQFQELENSVKQKYNRFFGQINCSSYILLAQFDKLTQKNRFISSNKLLYLLPVNDILKIGQFSQQIHFFLLICSTYELLMR